MNEINNEKRKELVVIEFQRKKQYNNTLFTLLHREISIDISLYELKGITLTPQSDHFITLLLNLESDIFIYKMGINIFMMELL